ncbi:phenylalanine--tRNA ligase subunit alpha [Blochmannia endosymbiont of Camponotus (Colobopsis) obliquus]|uniref:phenylalanine--tRNA ligase subunit alpha n=1 Tax=Blochmannia endosymbiont of Camponotus (Colobopsis) obliquus TaxID=1505597 RepID=UPI00061A7F0E|nr:phenylalanine--tRNA ligase subunit alpha [Blochmannia endosymbiont of Camponotus (Colobopsis) obliquus]AKC60518.1 Phenylalanine--tRNA ligase alpha subunit [Blochmannia endosymbiont of Camponotus (Colobopsis) obliquus]
MLNISNLITQAKKYIEQSQDLRALELIKVAFLGKKGYIKQQIAMLCSLTYEERIKRGKCINQAKQLIQKLIYERTNILELKLINEEILKNKIDISLPGRKIDNGRLHPITLAIIKIKNFFKKLGFNTVYGLEIEDNYHNFDALNIPIHHPTRTDHDTFWLDSHRLLRTQTSSIQIRTMKSQQPPIRIIECGRVYRNDYDKQHTPMFHQIEGLMIDVNITFSNLKGILYDFLHDFFNKNIKIRFRPSYFPFTEPSAEIDIMEEKQGVWLEILGCGMVHPNVLRNVGINLERFSGFAFGIGIERLAMLNYGITDLRVFFKNDLRFLQQFK